MCYATWWAADEYDNYPTSKGHQMRWAHLRAEIARLEAAGHLTDWTETGIEGFTFASSGIVVTTDDSDARVALDEAKEEAASAVRELEEEQKRCVELGVERDKALEETEKLREELDQLRDPESGVTVTDYRERAREAAKSEAQWHSLCDAANRRTAEMAVELASIRKRKGVEPGIMAHCWDVSGFLNTVAHYASRLEFDDNARKTLEQMGHKAKQLRERIDATAKAGSAKAKAAA